MQINTDANIGSDKSRKSFLQNNEHKKRFGWNNLKMHWISISFSISLK